MKIILAPMDKLTDYYARDLLTHIGGYDLCISEFLRVTNQLYPKRVFYQRLPELHQKIDHNDALTPTKISHTHAGIPVFLQLLGNDTSAMSENAAKAVQLGAAGIDLNFGCPAKNVNQKEAGASLLNYPERIEQLVSAVRKAVPAPIPVTAKMRLGYDDASLARDNALAIQSGGANWLSIHARTKKDAYRPPAYWEALSPLSELLNIPIVANGEIWTVEDYFSCRTLSQCHNVMLGRGAMVTPDLALQIKAAVQNKAIHKLSWQSMTQLLERLYQQMLENKELDNKYIAPRLKLWIKWLTANYDEAEQVFKQIKPLNDPHQTIKLISVHP